MADYQDNDTDGRILSGLVEDLRDAVIEYQVGLAPVTRRVLRLYVAQFAQQKTLYKNSCKIIVSSCFVGYITDTNRLL